MNPLRHKSLQISEIFYSIQGESSYSGYPCIFIRLAGCNLRCSFCDTKYAYEESGQNWTIDQVLQFTETKPSSLIEVTGGEPLVQENIYPLMDELLKYDRTVLLETNGSMSLARVPKAIIKIMDLKCPDSGMHKRMVFDNFNYLSPADEIKFVISSHNDYKWAVQILDTYHLTQKAKILFSPNVSRIAPAELAHFMLKDQLQVRLQIQLHKILWPGNCRGA